MRKSVIFVIAVIFLISIVVVAMLGNAIRVDQFNVTFYNISITTYDKLSAKGVKVKELEFDELNGYVEFQVDYTYTPDNVTSPDKIEYSLRNQVKKRNGEEITIATITKYGKVSFTTYGTVTVVVTATDGSGESDTLEIRCLKPTTT